jgi:hypothetical protein
MTRDEIALESEHLDLLDGLAAAKASGDRTELAAAKAAVGEFRAYWRGIRAHFNPAPADGDGVATPDALTGSAKTPKAGA